VSWPLPDDLDSSVLESRLFKRDEEEMRPGGQRPTGWTYTASGSGASTSRFRCYTSSWQAIMFFDWAGGQHKWAIQVCWKSLPFMQHDDP
jgi:hypothetical protein